MIPNNARSLRITAAAGTELAGASFKGTVRHCGSPQCVSSLPTGLYTPRSFIAHAASLGHPCGHCPIFPTAASRRSLGRISVPVWPLSLSGRLPIVALVSCYLANKLIGRGPISRRSLSRSLIFSSCEMKKLSGIRPPFGGLSQTQRQVAHVLRTRSPLYSPAEADFLARLACIKHAASVRSEPGSNSP